MTDRRHLNIKYRTLNVGELNVTRITRLGGVKEAIRAAFPNALAHVDSPQIQFFDEEHNLITDLDDIPDDCFKKRADSICIG
ncbi:hypothetical protein BJ741DRAFT_586940, partial [Chytriomyces cf. hyalinus JEL632]